MAYNPRGNKLKLLVLLQKIHIRFSSSNDKKFNYPQRRQIKTFNKENKTDTTILVIRKAMLTNIIISPVSLKLRHQGDFFFVGNDN
jgi:hypothetical protein